MKKEFKNFILFYKKNAPNLPSQAFTVIYYTYISYLGVTVKLYLHLVFKVYA